MGTLLSKSSNSDSADQLRQEANAHAQKRNEYFEQSQQAYRDNQKALAKELSDKGKAEDLLFKEKNKKAAELAYKENNQNRPKNEIDLHGLYVKEAVEVAEREIKLAKKRKDKEIVFIVGMGNNSVDGIRKIKPAVEELMEKYNFTVTVDKPTKGCLLVDLSSGRKGWMSSCIIS